MANNDSSRRLRALLNRFEGAEFAAATTHGTRWDRARAAARYAGAALALHDALQYAAVPAARRGYYGADARRIAHMKAHIGSMTRFALLRRMMVVSTMMDAHQEALVKGDFRLMERAFDSYVRMERRECERLKGMLPDIAEPFDVMLDRHVPGLRFAHIQAIEKAIFAPCVEAAHARGQGFDPDLRYILGNRNQEKIGRLLMERMGFDGARADVRWSSARPFIRGYGNDVKLIVRPRAGDFTWMLTDLMHEAAGHGVYRQSAPRVQAWRDTLAGTVPDAAADEVPALMLEHFVAKTKGFAQFVHRAMTDADANPHALTADEIHNRMQTSVRNRSRVEADLRTYPLQALQRIRVVRDMINGTKEAADYPKIWKRYEGDYFLPGARDDREGMLGDLQMFTGYAGYFGSYIPALMAAAREFERMGRAVPDWEEKLGQGDFSPVLNWMKANIFERGAAYRVNADPTAFVRYMQAKFPPRPPVGSTPPAFRPPAP